MKYRFRLNNLQKQLVRNLYIAESGVEAYTLYRKMRISPFVAAELVDGLLKRGFVEVKEKRILLKKDTRLMIQKKPELIATDDRPWRKIPEQFVQQKLEINQPYVPRIKEIKKLGGFANELD